MVNNFLTLSSLKKDWDPRAAVIELKNELFLTLSSLKKDWDAKTKAETISQVPAF